MKAFISRAQSPKFEAGFPRGLPGKPSFDTLLNRLIEEPEGVVKVRFVPSIKQIEEVLLGLMPLDRLRKGPTVAEGNALIIPPMGQQQPALGQPLGIVDRRTLSILNADLLRCIRSPSADRLDMRGIARILFMPGREIGNGTPAGNGAPLEIFASRHHERHMAAATAAHQKERRSLIAAKMRFQHLPGGIHNIAPGGRRSTRLLSAWVTRQIGASKFRQKKRPTPLLAEGKKRFGLIEAVSTPCMKAHDQRGRLPLRREPKEIRLPGAIQRAFKKQFVERIHGFVKCRNLSKKGSGSSRPCVTLSADRRAAAVRSNAPDTRRHIPRRFDKAPHLSPGSLRQENRHSPRRSKNRTSPPALTPPE